MLWFLLLLRKVSKIPKCKLLRYIATKIKKEKKKEEKEEVSSSSSSSCCSSSSSSSK